MKQFSYQDRVWVVCEGVEPDFLKTIQSPPSVNVSVVQENKVRTSFFLNMDCKVLPVVFVKKYKPGSWVDLLKYLLFPAKAKQEWDNLCLFQKNGINCPSPVAFSVPPKRFKAGSSFLVTKAIKEAIPLNKYVEKTEKTFAETMNLAQLLGDQVRQIHEKGIYYRDLHAGNILIKERAEKEIFFTDLHRAFRLPILPDFFRIKDVAKLCASLSVSTSLKTAFLKSYCKDERYFRLFFEKTFAQAQRIKQKHNKTRSKRCGKNSTLFEVKKSLTATYCVRRTFGYHQALELIARHKKALVLKDAVVVKQTPKSALTVHRTGDGFSVAVKGNQRNVFKSIFTASRAMKSWKASHGLSVRGINTPEALSVVEKRRGMFHTESYLLTRWLESAMELNDYIAETTFNYESKRCFIRLFAGTLKRLHGKAIYHADLKSNNILVTLQTDGRADFYFIDLDRVYFQQNLSHPQRINNLAQINASVSRVMTPKDRLRFFYYYTGKKLSKPLRKLYYSKILDISRKKVTEPYGITFE